MITPTSTEQRTAEIRQRMQAIRCALPSGMEQARENFSNFTDWKHYVRSYPAIVLPLVAIAAYSLVPRVREAPGARVAFMDSDQGVRRVRVIEEPEVKKSFMAGIAGSLLTLALRQGSTLAVSQLMHVLNSSKNSA